MFPSCPSVENILAAVVDVGPIESEEAGTDVIGENAGIDARATLVDTNAADEDENTDCCAAASDGRLRKASRLRERAVLDAMVQVQGVVLVVAKNE